MQNLITMTSIQQHQFKDLDLNILKQHFPYQYLVKEIQGQLAICYTEHKGDKEPNWKIVFTIKLILQSTVQ